jgi:hypothetical protein
VGFTIEKHIPPQISQFFVKQRQNLLKKKLKPTTQTPDYLGLQLSY